jgi:hypothetical protein
MRHAGNRSNGLHHPRALCILPELRFYLGGSVASVDAVGRGETCQTKHLWRQFLQLAPEGGLVSV